MPDPTVKAASKSDETRARILAAALELFRAKGFEETTMRKIAVAAGVATGAAYYYFDSKDAIVLAFYDRAQQDMEPLLDEVLDASKDLTTRLRGIIDVKLEYFKSSRRLLGALAAHTDPEHPLSPFSAQTEAIRASDTRSFARALEGGRAHVPEDLREYLPRILWMYQMGIILFWIYDRSAGQKKTRALVDKSLAVVVRLIALSRLPLTKPLRRIVIGLVDTVTEEI